MKEWKCPKCNGIAVEELQVGAVIGWRVVGTAFDGLDYETQPRLVDGIESRTHSYRCFDCGEVVMNGKHRVQDADEMARLLKGKAKKDKEK
jgi:DNA-directed RNA polymerase subunit RPC12/RpoP